MPLAQSGGASPRGLSVQVRDLGAESEDPAEAVYNVNAPSSSELLGQGHFEVSQGGQKSSRMLNQGE